MEFLNIGTGELLFLVLLAILIIGPRRTVELSRQAGRLLSRLQMEWRNVQRELMTEMKSLEDEVNTHVRGAVPPELSKSPVPDLDEEETE
jgi:sec-independent protein translocase protein TatB